MTAPLDIRELRFRGDVERLHRLRPRALASFLDELGAERLLRTEIESKLQRYGRTSSDVLIGADQFAPLPIWRVGR